MCVPVPDTRGFGGPVMPNRSGRKKWMPITPSEAGFPIISAASQRFIGSRTYPSASATFTSRNRSVAARTWASVGSPRSTFATVRAV